MAEPLEAADPLPFEEQRERYPELLLDLADRMQHKLMAHGLTEADAHAIAWDITEHIRHAWGGAAPYIPKGWLYEITKQHRVIYDEFSKGNYQELALKHDVSVQHVYRVVKLVGEEERRRRQRSIFDEPPSLKARG